MLNIYRKPALFVFYNALVSQWLKTLDFYYWTLPKIKRGDCVIPCVPNMWLSSSCVTGMISLSPASHAGLSTAAGIVLKKKKVLKTKQSTKKPPKPKKWEVISHRKTKVLRMVWKDLALPSAGRIFLNSTFFLKPEKLFFPHKRAYGN